MLLTYPLMVAIQEISARIGRVTGHGLAGNVCRHFPGSLLWLFVLLLAIANTVNVAADLAAMGDILKLLIGGPRLIYIIVFGAASVTAQIYFDYARYVAVLKWLTLSLFAYVAALVVVKIPWDEALRGLFVPSVHLSGDFLTTIVAIFGTTISPYLFIWQSSQEAEEQRVDKTKHPLKHDRTAAQSEFRRIRLDTLVGMAFSNLIAIAIIITTAAVLHGHGITDVQSSAQAAKALEPVAGPFAEVIFALGIIGTGLLAIPVLAGSTAYAVAEGRKWPVGLARKPKQAVAFYTVLAIAAAAGIGIDLAPLDPIKALYWSAVINGIIAAPFMVVIMILARSKEIMGRFAIRGWLYWLGWASTVAMTFCIIGMGVSLLIG
jgi:Mn2+/Fe2+ NRAMP family transporter